MSRKRYQFYECGWKCAAQMAKCICTPYECNKKCKFFPKNFHEECNANAIYKAVATVSKLERQLKNAKEFIDWIAVNAEKELWQTIRDKAIETLFNLNHPEIKEESDEAAK